MLKEREKIESNINKLKMMIKKLPSGKIICSRNGPYYKWYQSDGKKKKYIPKKNRKLAEQLAIKKYLTYQMEDLTREREAIESYLQHYAGVGKAEKMLAEGSRYQELLSPYFQPLSKELLKWMQSPYDSNKKYLEQKNIKTVSGNTVRSKSEALIDLMLYTNKIPFRYESELQLGNIIVYPDFTIRHPKTGKTYFWEHFGLMDDSLYCKSAISKLQSYISNGIIPTINLITTYETKENPLNTDMLETIIKLYFD